MTVAFAMGPARRTIVVAPTSQSRLRLQRYRGHRCSRRVRRDCAADTDGDGIRDDVDDCVGAYDDCGICNGPGAIR